MKKILRLKDVIDATGLSRSSIYLKISEGTFCTPVKLSKRAIGWPSNEVEAINQARISGKTDNEIHDLVKELEALRGGAL